MTNALVMSWKALIICMMRLNRMIGESSGMVICQKMRIRPAPSILAASYWLTGICFRPARKSSMDEPNCQTVTRLMVPNA